jgi:hypothetical protein
LCSDVAYGFKNIIKVDLHLQLQDWRGGVIMLLKLIFEIEDEFEFAF